MVTRCSMSSDHLVVSSDAGTGLVRICETDLVQLEKHLFQRYPHREWGTFFRFGYRRTSWGIAVCFVDGLWPGPGDLDRQTALTTFHEDYSRRAFHESSNVDGLAIGVAHSHPVGCPVRPSALDDDMDGYFAEELASFSGGRPYCSLIFERSERGLSFSGRIYDRGRWLPVSSMVGVGETVNRWRSQLMPLGLNVIESSEESPTARLQSLMGAPSELRFRDSTVGVVGNSGTGSPIVAVLARARVGNFAVVDPQRFAPSNLERMYGSEWKHLLLNVPPFKAELMRDMIHGINPDAKVVPLVGNILHPNVIDELLRCDFVLGCTDSVHGRVAIDELARHYLVPVIDVGVRMDGADGKLTEQLVNVAAYRPGLPCAFCRDNVDAYVMSYELMSEAERREKEEQAADAAARGIEADQYWRGRPRQLHTVGYLTTVAGALVAGYVEGALSGSFTMPHPEFQFDIGKPGFGFVVPPLEFNSPCGCQSHLGWADAASPYKNVAIPAHWSRRAVLLPSREALTSVSSRESA